MKKKLIIIISVLLVLICAFCVYFIFDNNKVVETITLDINPSIEIGLNKKGNVQKIKALNKDGKKIVTNNINGKSLEDALEIIAKNVVKNDYALEDTVDIIVGMEKDNKTVEKKIRDAFAHQDVGVYIIIPKITEKDKKLAKKYNITPAKASVISEVLESNSEVKINDLLEKPAGELNEMKESGRYCDSGYTLRGDFCEKKIREEKAEGAKVCPKGTIEYNGVCYEEGGYKETDEYVCNDDFTLEGTKCKNQIIENATPVKYSCSKGVAKTNLELGRSNPGDGNANDIVCVDTSNATHPMSPCEVNDGTEYMVSGGRCYWHRAPVIESGCPGKIQVGGSCWDDASSVLICRGARDGKRYSSRDEYCEDSIKYITPTVTEYKCENKKATLNGDKCIIEEEHDADHKMICSKGYTEVESNGSRCINLNKTKSKVDGYVCNMENSRLVKNVCYIYEIVDSKVLDQ